MSHEIDGKGNVKIWRFTVKCFYPAKDFFNDNGALFSQNFIFETDYSRAWDSARQTIQCIEDNDPDRGTPEAFQTKVIVEYAWVPEETLDSLESLDDLASLDISFS